MQGTNIFSGEKGLGGALTNPTELARRKGSIQEYYPVRFQGKRYPDVETAYHALQQSDGAANDRLMVELIAAKFQQHPSLREEVRARGGRGFLEACRHWTQARSASAQSWEGEGLQSRFIRNLVAGYELAESGWITEGQQHSLL